MSDGLADGFNLFEAWKEYEKVAMHFNDLLIRLRAQSLGAVAAIATIAGVVLRGDGVTPQLRWGTLAGVFAGLALLWAALWILDFMYYNRLLLGAVDALLTIEKASKSGNVMQELNLSTDIEAAVKGEPKGRCSSRDTGRWAFYLIVFVVLVLGLGVSLYGLLNGGFAFGPPAPAAAAQSPATSTWGVWLWSNGPADVALVFVGIVTGWIAISTLRSLRRQVAANVQEANAANANAIAAQQSAQAAVKQADVALQQVAVMRAQLQAEHTDRLKEYKPVATTEVLQSDAARSYVVRNVGSSPAINVWYMESTDRDAVRLGAIAAGDSMPVPLNLQKRLSQAGEHRHLLIAESRHQERRWTVTINIIPADGSAVFHMFAQPKHVDHRGAFGQFIRDELEMLFGQLRAAAVE